MDRRSFLIGAGSAIITFSFYRQVLRHTERKAAPLIMAPDYHDTELFAVAAGDGSYDLYLGAHPLDDQPPDWTWRQFASEAWGWSDYELTKYLIDCNGFEKEEEAEGLLDTPADSTNIYEWYARWHSANARAYYELQRLDLGPELGVSGSRGEICFIDGPCPGNDSLIVKAEDMTSLSLLQARLNEIEAGILVRPTTW